MTQAQAAADVVADLRERGLIDTPMCEAFALMAVELAEQCDIDPANASLWREYRQGLLALRKEATPVDDDGPDPIEKLLEELNEA